MNELSICSFIWMVAAIVTVVLLAGVVYVQWPYIEGWFKDKVRTWLAK